MGMSVSVSVSVHMDCLLAYNVFIKPTQHMLGYKEKLMHQSVDVP